MDQEKFSLYHFALYSKGWYKRYNPKGKNKTIWDDLKVILTLDDYQGEFMSKKDIIYVVLNHCSRLNKPAFKDLSLFAEGISEDECWKYGYYTDEHQWMFSRNETLPKYDQKEAIIRYCMSNVSNCSKKELGVENLPFPNYEKGLPRKNGITDKDLKEIFT